MEYRHEVPEAIRLASRWDPENCVNVAPTGATWIYVDPGLAHGAKLLDSNGEEVLVARWYPAEHLAFARCLTPEQVSAQEHREQEDADRVNGVIER